MRSRKVRAHRPCLESLEGRRLLTQAVVEILNKSTYNITFSFRWDASSAWTSYSEAPGQYELLWADDSGSLAPEAQYNTSTFAGSQTTVNLAQGYGRWEGSGTPPTSSATLYQFQNTATDLLLYYAAPPTPTVADVVVRNESSYTITFDFRWTSTSSWSEYTEAPGQGQIFWTPYSDSLTPQALYDTSSSPGSQLTINLAQGYGQWTGNGTPPASTASPYEFLDNSGGVTLYFGASAPKPTPAPAPDASPNLNWSGYVAATDLSDPKAGSVTAVSGTWNVPAVSGPSGVTLDSSTWIGIDGASPSDPTVEQLGTEQDVIDGQPFYQAWWEMYSDGLKQPEQPIRSMTILPGDSISASVQYINTGIHAGQFLLDIVDNSRPNDSFSTYQTSSSTQSPLAQGSSAEWIMEAPSVGGQIAKIPTFSTVNFTNATAVIDGVSGPINSPSWKAKTLYLTSDGGPSGTVLDTTSSLDGSGTGFSVSSNSSVAAGVQSGSGLVTSQVAGGAVDPQVIVVGGQPPGPSASRGVPGDYDGSGRTEPAIYLPQYGVFAYLSARDGSPHVVPYGPAGQGFVAVPGDYLGDGRTDLAVYSSQYGVFAYERADGVGSTIVPFGPAGAGAVPSTSPRPGGLTVRSFRVAGSDGGTPEYALPLLETTSKSPGSGLVKRKKPALAV